MIWYKQCSAEEMVNGDSERSLKHWNFFNFLCYSSVASNSTVVHAFHQFLF